MKILRTRWLLILLSGMLLAAFGRTRQSSPPASDNSQNLSETTPPTTPSTMESEKKMSINKEPYGKTPDGAAVDLYTLTNANGLKIKLITYGATIIDVETPDRHGKMENINLFRDSLEDYMKPDTPYFGCTVGRYANRIAKGKF